MSSQICPVCGVRSTVELKWADGKWRCEIRCPRCGTSSAATHERPGESRRRAVGAWEAIEISRRPRYAPLVGMTFACLSVVSAATALGPLWGVWVLVWALLTCATISCLTVSR